MTPPIYPRSISALLQAVRMARANPNMRFSGPGLFPDLSANDVLKLWSDGIQRRCSRGLNIPARAERGFVDLMVDAGNINDYRNRIRHSGGRNLLRTPWLKKRYPHIDNQPMADF